MNILDIANTAAPSPSGQAGTDNLGGHAGVSLRCLATLWDLLIFTALLLLLKQALIYLGMISPDILAARLSPENLGSPLALSCAWVVPMLTFIGILSAFEASQGGATPGKMMMGIQVIDYQDDCLLFSKAFLRNITKLSLALLGVPLVLLLCTPGTLEKELFTITTITGSLLSIVTFSILTAYLITAVNCQGQLLHDALSASLVVRRTHVHELQRLGFGIIAFLILVLLLLWSWNAAGPTEDAIISKTSSMPPIYPASGQSVASQNSTSEASFSNRHKSLPGKPPLENMPEAASATGNIQPQPSEFWEDSKNSGADQIKMSSPEKGTNIRTLLSQPNSTDYGYVIVDSKMYPATHIEMSAREHEITLSLSTPEQPNMATVTLSLDRFSSECGIHKLRFYSIKFDPAFLGFTKDNNIEFARTMASRNNHDVRALHCNRNETENLHLELVGKGNLERVDKSKFSVNWGLTIGQPKPYSAH